MTLQGAIAHVDMPIESGPTHFLPYSQLYDAGYVASTDPSFIEYFEKHCVQSPISKGDAVFFSPGIFHGAGKNNTGGLYGVPSNTRRSIDL